jgi:hypothetical protein
MRQTWFAIFLTLEERDRQTEEETDLMFLLPDASRERKRDRGERDLVFHLPNAMREIDIQRKRQTWFSIFLMPVENMICRKRDTQKEEEKRDRSGSSSSCC